jgi:hypothetical protein
MQMKQILERLERLERVIDNTQSMAAIHRELDALKLDIEIDCRKEGIELVDC